MPNFNPFSNDSENTSFEQGTPVTQAAKTVTNAAAANANPNITPEEQAKMERIRQELFGSYSATFKAAAQNGAQNITTSLDQEMEKARKQREQAEMQRKQEEEEEEKRRQEEAEA